MDKNSTNRFSGREDNYAKYRPGYPKEMMEWLQSDDVGIWEKDVIADIGMGTGIGAKLFLEAGCTVYGVEPNKEMRVKAEQELESYEKFHSVDGTAENTTLPSRSIDNIVCCQSFHWFDVDKTRDEFKRILKSPSYEVIIIWNEHQDSKIMEDYEEKILERYCIDKTLIRKRGEAEEKYIKPFYAGSGYEKKEFKHSEDVDFETFKGRIFSYSDMPTEEKATPEMLKDIEDFFAKHMDGGVVKLEYVTMVYNGCVGLTEKDFENEQIQNFVNSVKKYATTVENYENYSLIGFLSEVSKDLALIYHTYLCLPEIPYTNEYFNDNERFGKREDNTFSNLYEFIGEKYRGYLFIFHPYHKDHKPCGSMLAEDIESIYSDLLPIVKFFDNSSEGIKQDILWNVQLHFNHWGHHLTSALHALNAIIYHYNGLDRNESENYDDMILGNDEMVDDKNNINELISTIREYCSLVENYNNFEAKDFFSRIGQLFSKISYAMLALPRIPFSNIPDKDLIHKQTNIEGIKTKYGEIIYYYSFNPFKKDEPVSNDLIMDISEIYHDLKEELEKYDSGDDELKQDALWQLQSGYESHWGRHMAVSQNVIYHYLNDNYWGDS